MWKRLWRYFLFVWAVSGDCGVCALCLFQLSEAGQGDPSLMETGLLTDQGSMREGGPCSPTADPTKSEAQLGSPFSPKGPPMRSWTFMWVTNRLGSPDTYSSDSPLLYWQAQVWPEKLRFVTVWSLVRADITFYGEKYNFMILIYFASDDLPAAKPWCSLWVHSPLWETTRR